MTKEKARVWAGLFVATLLFAPGAKAQAVRHVNTASGILVNGGTSATGPTVNLSIASGGIANSSLANSSLTVSPSTGLSGGGTVSLGGSVSLGIDTSVVPRLGSANNFTATQTISSGDLSISNGNLDLRSTSGSNAGVLTLGGSPFLHSFGIFNTFLGTNAGNFTMGGTGANTGIGFQVLQNNTTGNANTAIGVSALRQNTSGSDNTAIGIGALLLNTTGGANTALGANALLSNTTGLANAAIGGGALFSNTTGSSNIAVGPGAGTNLTTGDFNIDIGNDGTAGEANTIRIGTTAHTPTFIAGISGVATGLSGAFTVLVDANGQLGTTSSSRRFKYDIQDMGETSGDLWRLRPVTFRYKQAQNGGAHPLQYGLIAEEVADVYPGLVQFDSTGQPNAVLYHVLPVLLLNEAKKQHQLIEELKAANGALREQVAQLKEEQTEIRQLRAEVEGLKAAIGRQSTSQAVALK